MFFNLLIIMYILDIKDFKKKNRWHDAYYLLRVHIHVSLFHLVNQQENGSTKDKSKEDGPKEVQEKDVPLVFCMYLGGW